MEVDGNSEEFGRGKGKWVRRYNLVFFEAIIYFDGLAKYHCSSTYKSQPGHGFRELYNTDHSSSSSSIFFIIIIKSTFFSTFLHPRVENNGVDGGQ